VIRIAAVGDVHFGHDSHDSMRPDLESLQDSADLLLIAGDLTRHGSADEAAVLADEFQGLEVPAVAVLGNHDYHCGQENEIREVIEGSGVHVLEGENEVIDIEGGSVGIAGTKGFGGGFAGACATDFGEPEMKAFVRHTQAQADRLNDVLSEIEADARVVLLHYSPVEATLVGERLEIYPFLGSYLLAEAIDDVGADLVVHGHAHNGKEKGVTPGGVHVRNVAQPVIQRTYNLYCLGSDDEPVC
jgi:Icc-related predicted phosphoesterase